MVRCIKKGQKEETACTFSDLKRGDVFFSSGQPQVVGHDASYYVGKGYIVFDTHLKEYGLEEVDRVPE